MKLTLDLLQKIPKQKVGRSAYFPDKITPFIAYLNEIFEKYKINTPARIAAFMAQAIVESACFTQLKENTNYSLERAVNLWPRRFNFNNGKKSIDYLQPITYVNLIYYQNRPDTIVNRAYAGKNGNSEDETIGDGLRYAGRGIFQITGKDNYTNCGISLQVDLVNHPELLEQPLYACRSAGWFWSTHKFNVLADNGDIDKISRIVNGGDHKITDRRSFWDDFKSALETEQKKPAI